MKQKARVKRLKARREAWDRDKASNSKLTNQQRSSMTRRPGSMSK